MKYLIFILAVVTAVTAGIYTLSCRSVSGGEGREMPPIAVSNIMENELPKDNDSAGTGWGDYKDLLFVDQSLEYFARENNFPDPRLFSAYESIQLENFDKAKQHLREVLADPELEVRTHLWASQALRELGEKPGGKNSNEIKGVVLEVPVGGWTDTLAAYSDGRARYLNGSGGSIIWESPEDRKMSALISEVISAAQPVISKCRTVAKHEPPQNGVIRATLLTYGGIYVIEAPESEVMSDKKHTMAPLFNAGTKLFFSLLKLNEETQNKHKNLNDENEE